MKYLTDLRYSIVKCMVKSIIGCCYEGIFFILSIYFVEISLGMFIFLFPIGVAVECFFCSHEH